MADYPTPEQLADPTFVWPMEFAAPQDRGEPAPAANPSPGPGNETEPRTDMKEFKELGLAPGEWMKGDDSANYDGPEVQGPQKVDEPASRAGAIDVESPDNNSPKTARKR